MPKNIGGNLSKHELLKQLLFQKCNAGFNVVIEKVKSHAVRKNSGRE